MADKDLPISSADRNEGNKGDQPPQKMIRLEELQETVTGLIQKSLEEAGV